MEEETQNNVIDNDDNSTVETTTEEETIEKETEVVGDNEDESSPCEDKLQRALADYQNLERRSQNEISQKVRLQTNQLMLNFIGIYEDFLRAKSTLTSDGINTEGLEAVIKNMDALLSENNIKVIDAIGEIFDPRLHEAVSIIEDDSFDDGTITQEIAKGYISREEVIRPSKVIVSKKPKR